MKKDYDFSKAQQGKFYIPIEELEIPTYSKHITDFISKIDELYGYFLDSIIGFFNNYKQIDDIQKQTIKNIRSDVVLDDLTFSYGKGDPNDPNSIELHRTSQGKLKKRNEKNGDNCILAARFFIILTYIFWEEEYREKIANALKINKNNLIVPIIGDLRMLRNDIIHHQSIITKETISKLKVINKFKEGEEIRLLEKEVENLVAELKKAVYTINEQYNKKNQLLNQIKKTVLDIEPKAEVIIYGSRSRDDAASDSDWDFLVLLDDIVNDERIDNIRHRLYEIEWETGEIISCIVINKEQWNSSLYKVMPFHKNVEYEGVIL
jgi:predicted nucleotidyltransferase